MSIGLQIFDNSGRSILDLSAKTTRYLGKFTINSSSGSHTDNNINGGRVWVMPAFNMSYQGGWSVLRIPRLIINGNTISWEDTDNNGAWLTDLNVTMIYGVY